MNLSRCPSVTSNSGDESARLARALSGSVKSCRSASSEKSSRVWWKNAGRGAPKPELSSCSTLTKSGGGVKYFVGDQLG